MAKFLFVIPPFWGHINPTLSVGGTLLERGHEVAWAGMTQLNTELFPSGAQYFYMEKTENENKEEIERIILLQNKGANMPALEALKLGLEDTYIPFAKMMIDEFNEIVDQYKPDVIINDCITFVGGLSAQLKNIPFATLTPITPNALNDPQSAPKVTAWVHNSIIDLQRLVGIEGDEECIQSKLLNIYYTSQLFCGFDDASVPPYMKFIGALTGRPDNTPFDWERLKAMGDRPKIYISIGTVLVQSRKDFFSRMIEALKDKPVTVIAAADPNILEEWPDNFIVQGYVPQSELLKHIDVVIGHGGLNTTCDTFMNGIPMLIIPMAFDQSHTAQLIHNYGCGIRIKYSRMRVKDIEHAVDELLYNPIYKKAAKEIQQSFIEAGGNERAAQLLEKITIRK
ncbi:MAG: glycosyltransferase [Dysgonomonas sp.]